MEFLTFKKGIHPPHGKYLTEKNRIEDLLPKGDLVFPLSQHIGAPCQPLVQKGDRVLAGQRIGEANGFVSAHIYSSVSGTVKNIAPVLTSGGTKVNSIIIENDGKYEEAEFVKPKDYNNMTSQEIIKCVQDAGIVGMGGAGFPTHVKLSPGPDKKIDSIIVNAAECEPYLTCDHRMMLEEGKDIVEGLNIILKLFPDAKGYIGIENNKMDAVKAMQDFIKELGYTNIEVKTLQTKYPQGAEKQLIYAITKREVPSGKLPADAGAIVQNVDTVRCVYNAVVLGRPVMTRVVTVTGEAVMNPKNLRVKLGTNWTELLEACGGFKENPVKVIGGGPMMGMTVCTLNLPVVKGTSGILALTEKEAELPKEIPCIRCAKCVQACPMDLIPTTLDSLSRRQELDRFEKGNGVDCIECGCCTYVCPSKRHLLQTIRNAKRTVLANKRKK